MKGQNKDREKIDIGLEKMKEERRGQKIEGKRFKEKNVEDRIRADLKKLFDRPEQNENPVCCYFVIKSNHC